MPFDEMVEDGILLLPGGYHDGEKFHRKVEIRPLSGLEEEIIADKSLNENTAKLITAILTNCILRIGPIREVTSEIVRRLLVADRDYIILRLRQLTFGNRVEGTIICSQCDQKIDIDFDLDDIEVKHENELKPTFTMCLSKQAAYKTSGEIHQEVEFRLPNGADQEEIAPWIGINEAKVLTELYARCIKRIGSIENITTDLIRSLSILARREIEAKIREVAPSLDLNMKVKCPYCNLDFVDNFNIHSFFLMS